MIIRSISLKQFVSVAASVTLTESLTRRFTTVCEAPIQPKPPKITLYQYQTCPFCNRVKAYLDFLKIDYDSVEVNPLTKSEIKFSKENKKVPIAVINDETKAESGQIIDYITQNFSSGKIPSPAFFPDDTVKWSDWSEKRLAVYLYPNITRSYSESWECFSYANNVPTWSKPLQIATQVAGSAAMTFANGKIKKKYNIVNERAELNQELQLWIDAVGNKRFLHGDKLTMPDVMVYGVLRSIEGLATFREIMENSKALYTWYKNVDQEIRRK